MNLRNYEITVICDFQLCHLLVNLGSIPDLRSFLHTHDVSHISLLISSTGSSSGFTRLHPSVPLTLASLDSFGTTPCPIIGLIPLCQFVGSLCPSNIVSQ
jgi:hypothetical protein